MFYSHTIWAFIKTGLNPYVTLGRANVLVIQNLGKLLHERGVSLQLLRPLVPSIPFSRLYSPLTLWCWYKYCFVLSFSAQLFTVSLQQGSSRLVCLSCILQPSWDYLLVSGVLCFFITSAIDDISSVNKSTFLPMHHPSLPPDLLSLVFLLPCVSSVHVDVYFRSLNLSYGCRLRVHIFFLLLPLAFLYFNRISSIYFLTISHV
jgi:hypothetical protein